MSNRKLFFPFILILLTLIPVVFAQEYTPTALEVTVYSEGSTKIDYDIESDPIEARITVGLFGPPFNNVAIRDEENNPITYRAEGLNMSIDSLGALDLNIQYLTSSLTTKEGALWTLNMTLPVYSKIIIPLGAAVVDLNKIPSNIGTVDGKQFMEFTEGDLSLYYIIGLPSIIEESGDAIEEASTYIDQKTALDYILTDAATLLQSAESEYQSENYVVAKSSAEEALALAQSIISDAEKAAQALIQAETAIDSAEEQGRTEGLDAADQAYDSALASYGEGEYSTAEIQAKTSVQLAQNSTEPASGGNSMMYLGLGVIVIAGAGGYLYMQNKGKEEELSSSNGQVKVNVDRILSEHDTLRMEDREVIKFIAESNGEAFASEIRERFDLPRSSTWRLIRRLEELKIIEESKIGNQSLIRINPTYHS